LADLDTRVGAETFKRFAIRPTPTTLVLGGDGSEVDWVVGYSPPPENFQISLERILKGENTFQALEAAYAKNPKDVAAVFGVARKWSDRHDTAKAMEKYKVVIALDPEGTAGSFTDPDTQITAPYTKYAEYDIAIMAAQGRNPDLGPVKAFISENPKSLLAKRAYALESRYYSLSNRPNEEAAKFFEELTAAYPDDPGALVSWLRKIVRDKGPMDKGAELASRLRALTFSDSNPTINLTIAAFYDLAGDKAKAEEVYGQAFMNGQIATNSFNLLVYANYWARKKENLESAIAAAETAVKLQPDYIVAVASLYIEAGQEAKALELFGPGWLAKKITQKSDQEISGYAQFWAGQGKNLASALTAAKKAVELQPKAYLYWATLSDVYAKMNNKAKAVKAVEKAVELAKGNAKAAMQRKLDALKAPEKK